jgi:hypothetical protein
MIRFRTLDAYIFAVLLFTIIVLAIILRSPRCWHWW